MPPPQALNGNIADLIAERHHQQQPALPAHAFEGFMLPLLGGWSGVGDYGNVGLQFFLFSRVLCYSFSSTRTPLMGLLSMVTP